MKYVVKIGVSQEIKFVFAIHGLTSDDEAGGRRIGGVGSTGV